MRIMPGLFFLNDQAQPLDFPAVLRAGGHNVDAGGIDAVICPLSALPEPLHEKSHSLFFQKKRDFQVSLKVPCDIFCQSSVIVLSVSVSPVSSAGSAVTSGSAVSVGSAVTSGSSVGSVVGSAVASGTGVSVGSAVTLGVTLGVSLGVGVAVGSALTSGSKLAVLILSSVFKFSAGLTLYKPTNT